MGARNLPGGRVDNETQRTSAPCRSRLPAGQMAARQGARRVGERTEWIRLKRLFA